jgi:DNA-binding NarL/FixJ family response regulator
MGICGWEHLPALPASNQDAPSTRTNRSARRQRAQPLSAREQEIAGLIGQGLRDREIAAALVVSEHTVHAHVRNLLDKLGLASRAQVAVWGAEHGLLPSSARAGQPGLSSTPAAHAEP